MPRQRVTSFDVAKRAGVSQSAVSRTFTPGTSVSAATREKVMAAARELHYRPNAIARSLITKSSRLVAVVVAYLDNLFYPGLLEALSQRLAIEGYQVLLFTGFKDRNSDPVMAEILQYRVAGLILVSTTLSSSLAAECAASGMPVVLINRKSSDRDVSSVTSDNLRGGELAAEYLLAGGHRSFAYVAGTTNSSTSRDRCDGFCERLRRSGHQPIIVAGHYSQHEAARAARALFRTTPIPEAVFCANDHMAIAVLDVARYEFGLQVPEEVSIVGYDDAAPSRWLSYDLTTVEQPIPVMVDKALAILMGQIDANGPVEHEQEVIEAKVIVRGSARRPMDGIEDVDGTLVFVPPGQAQTHTF